MTRGIKTREKNRRDETEKLPEQRRTGQEEIHKQGRVNSMQVKHIREGQTVAKAGNTNKGRKW